jgi:hypothetical protein
MPSCRAGHQDYCYTGDFRERRIKEAHGYMAEYVVEQERHVNLVQPDLRVSPGLSALVLGIGPVGLLDR